MLQGYCEVHDSLVVDGGGGGGEGGREGWDFCKKIVAGGKKNWRKGKEEKQGKTL